MTGIRSLKPLIAFVPLAVTAMLAIILTACSGGAAAQPAAELAGPGGDASTGANAAPPDQTLLIKDDTSAPVVSADMAARIAENGVLPSSVGGKNSLLKVRLSGVRGDRVPLKNGGAIQLEDNLVAEIFVDPYPTNTLTAWLDLYLHDGSGKPVTDAKVVIDYDMYSMAHGPFFTLAEKSPNGHYVFRLDYIMFGPWMQLLQVTPNGSETEHRIEIVLVAVP